MQAFEPPFEMGDGGASSEFEDPGQIEHDAHAHEPIANPVRCVYLAVWALADVTTYSDTACSDTDELMGDYFIHDHDSSVCKAFQEKSHN